jgi:hypothetical protein
VTAVVVALVAFPAGILVGRAIAVARVRRELRRRAALERTRIALGRIG